jgi:hypothetical protein
MLERTQPIAQEVARVVRVAARRTLVQPQMEMDAHATLDIMWTMQELVVLQEVAALATLMWMRPVQHAHAMTAIVSTLLELAAKRSTAILARILTINNVTMDLLEGHNTVLWELTLQIARSVKGLTSTLTLAPTGGRHARATTVSNLVKRRQQTPRWLQICASPSIADPMLIGTHLL